MHTPVVQMASSEWADTVTATCSSIKLVWTQCCRRIRSQCQCSGWFVCTGQLRCQAADQEQAAAAAEWSKLAPMRINPTLLLPSLCKQRHEHHIKLLVRQDKQAEGKLLCAQTRRERPAWSLTQQIIAWTALAWCWRKCSLDTHVLKVALDCFWTSPHQRAPSASAWGVNIEH